MRWAATAAVIAATSAGAALASSGPRATGLVSATGAGLYAANCSSCHGPLGQGIAPPGRPGAGGLTGFGPSLVGAGARATDFYLRTGYMPLANPREEPSRSQVLFTSGQIDLLVAYVASFGHGPPIPKPRPATGDMSAGFRLFRDDCAGCHQIAAEGGYVTGARVPPLDQATNVEIAEAIRTGPYVMPRFSERAISNTQLNSIVRYLDYAKHPADPGGWSIGRTGPIPEGMVTWLIALAALVAMCTVLGARLRHE